MKFTSNETLSDVVNLLSTFLEERPTEFAITILPIHREENIDEENKLALEESIVLVEKKYLGLDARSLPWITRTMTTTVRCAAVSSQGTGRPTIRGTFATVGAGTGCLPQAHYAASSGSAS